MKRSYAGIWADAIEVCEGSPLPRPKKRKRAIFSTPMPSNKKRKVRNEGSFPDHPRPRPVVLKKRKRKIFSTPLPSNKKCKVRNEGSFPDHPRPRPVVLKKRKRKIFSTPLPSNKKCKVRNEGSFPDHPRPRPVVLKKRKRKIFSTPLPSNKKRKLDVVVSFPVVVLSPIQDPTETRPKRKLPDCIVSAQAQSPVKKYKIVITKPKRTTGKAKQIPHPSLERKKKKRSRRIRKPSRKTKAPKCPLDEMFGEVSYKFCDYCAAGGLNQLGCTCSMC